MTDRALIADLVNTCERLYILARASGELPVVRGLLDEAHMRLAGRFPVASLKELTLASKMLEDAAEVYSNHGCNDWSFPLDWTKKEREEFVRGYHEWNGDPENFDSLRLHLTDSAVMSYLAHLLEQTQ